MIMPTIRAQEKSVINDKMQSLLTETDHTLQLLRALQVIKTRPSIFELPLLAVTVLAFVFGYHLQHSLELIACWTGLVLVSVLIKREFSKHIHDSIQNADIDQLLKNEQRLLAASLLRSIAVGSGYWWLAVAQPDSTIAYSIMLFSAIYTFDTLVNNSVQLNSFVIAAACNLGQGLVFFIGFGGPFEPVIVLGLIMTLGVQIGFSRVNAVQFEMGVRMQGENIALVDRLEKEKATVDNALNTAETANETKNQFLAAASHDLRQPLYALSLYLGSLDQVVGQGRGRDIVDKMTDAAAFLNDQFNSLLDLAQFDSGAITVRKSHFPVASLLERLVSSFESQAEKKGLLVELHCCPANIETDPQLLERVLRNLIENAIRYTDFGTITIRSIELDDKCRISISDTGKGISIDDQERIFQDFVQVNNAARHSDHGVGLGLAIVSRICNLLSHKLTLESELYKGSVFHIDLPISTQELEESPSNGTTNIKTHASSLNELNNVRIWVMDDNKEILDALQLQLQGWGCIVTLLSSEADLHAAYKSQRSWPKLIILDDMLAGEDSGLDIAMRLKNDVNQQHIALITGNTHGDRLKTIGKSGFTCLLKPVSNWELKNLVVTAANFPPKSHF